MKKLTDGLICYLTKDARALLDRFISMGIDQDLALILIDQKLSEIQVWDIPPKEEWEFPPSQQWGSAL